MSRITDRQQRLRAVVDEALLKQASARDAYLDRACAGDPELRSDVMRLVAAQEDTHSHHEPSTDRSPSDAHVEQHFSDTARFRVIQRLGTGGMGVVYEVHDSVRDEVVALKTLLRTSASAVYRLKREFRSLADVAHPNLACLYELFVDDARCFFTMELVRGVSFVAYARDVDRDRPSVDRLIHALGQLIEGVSALHQRGKLHRDIKPSNVLVTAEGRVVILDFGLIAETLPQHAGNVSYVSGGTPAYMSPEECFGATPSEASDWYCVGATLYEALTGSAPFAGAALDVVLRKRTDDPPAPAQLVPDLPRDLSEVCMGLMRRDPERRLTGPEALRQLGRRDTLSPISEAKPAAIRDAPFVGRDRQLHALTETFLAVKRGTASAVSIYGPSGIGKSALMRRFLSQVGTPDDVVVLAGRCYENESVPYKALDGVVDDLSRYLASIPREQVEQLMPSDMPALTRAFPVLLQVKTIANAPVQEPASVDPLDLRRRAFEALRELLGRLAARRPLVVWIDDLQWADADSAVLLEEVLRPPSQPAMLTALCFRSEETAAKPFLQALLERPGRDAWSTISLEPMTEDEALALVAGLLPADSALTDADKDRLTREAGGSPFVLEQLARYAGVNRMTPNQAPTFAAMFDTRLGTLSQDARCFLETLAICGRPMAPELICDACGVERERQSLVATLRSAHFIRSSGSSERVEPYHDRIRDVLARQIAPDALRRVHSVMVQVLVEKRSDDCEALFEHYRGAGDRANASIQAGLAAEKAGAALAFDRAALFYRQALALSPESSAAPVWREGFANALANAGRPAEAADAYIQATAGAGHVQRVELQRRAAEQFLIGGHIDRGLDLIRSVLAAVGVNPGRSPRAALFSLLWQRAQLRWRGLRFVSRRVDQIEPDALLRVDTCWSAASGLAMVDVIRASDFSARHLRMALDAGEPYRIARAMAIESAARSAVPADRPLSGRLAQQSQALAKASGNPHAIALSILAHGINATMVGEWKKALTLSEEALAILRDECAGRAWELTIAQNVVLWALMYRGELGEVSRQVPTLLANARSRGNLYLATELCTRANYVWLAADDPDGGERETIESIARWSHKGFHRQHYSAMLARVQTALYRGDGEAAWRLLAEHEPGLQDGP